MTKKAATSNGRPSGARIDVMTEADLPRVIELAGQLGYPQDGVGLRRRFQAIVNHADYALFVAKTTSADENIPSDVVVGWVQINIEPFALLTEPRAEIAALIVDEEQRGRNIGQALLAKAEEWARERDVMLLRLRSAEQREAAHRFYQREGYVLAKTSCVFTKSLET